MEPTQIAAFQAAVEAITQNGDAQASARPGAARVPVSVINRANAEHDAHADEWLDLALLSGPSTEVKKHAARFLMRRPKEIQDIFVARQQGFTYTNIIGNGLGWYVAKLFKDEIDIDVKVSGATINPAQDEEHEFYARFLDNCDSAGKSFTETMKETFRQLCVFRRSYVLLDLMPDVAQADNAAEQRIEPYLCVFDPTCVINCERDAYGNLQWIVFRTIEHTTPFLGQPAKITRWSYYDQTNYLIYEHHSSDERQPGDTEDMARLVAQGRHALADYAPYEGAPATGRVPVVDVEVPEILWLGARVYLQALDHLNTENALKWGLFLGNLAMPVIKTSSEYTPTIHEAGAIQLQPGDEYSFAEPSGKTFEISQRRLDGLREDMYRSMYLQAQGRSESATASAQSGISKEQDMAPGRDVLNSFGSVMRKHMLLILYLVRDIRQDAALDFEVRGLQHNDDPITDDIADAQQVQTLEVQSDTFHKEVQKQVVRRFGRTWSTQTIETICAEIDDAPTKSELDAETQKREDDAMESKMASSFKLVADDSADADKDNDKEQK
jgi:hypothetical protein